MRPALLLFLLLPLGLPAGAVLPTVIDCSNAAEHAARLSPGQQALLAALPATFRMPVATADSDPPMSAQYRADTQANAGRARLDDNGQLSGYLGGLPFPDIIDSDPDAGLKAIWNHRLRWRGNGFDQATVQAVVNVDGSVNRVDLRKRSRLLTIPERRAGDDSPLIAQTLSGIVAPVRLAGSLKLVHEGLSGALLAWQRSPGPLLPSLKATTDAGHDTPVIGADGLYQEDQQDGFSGTPDRWRWRLVGRRELLVPWDAHRFNSHGRSPETLLGVRHPDPALLRYAPRRIVQLEATLKPDRSSPWPRRHYYLDEATWQVLLVEFHDRHNRLERVQEVHRRWQGDQPQPSIDLIHDLPGKRYLVSGLDPSTDATQMIDTTAADFTPSAATRWAKAVGARPPRK